MINISGAPLTIELPAPEYYDNYSGPANPACFLTLDDVSKWAGQSFTTTTRYNLEHVDLWLKKSPGSDVGTVQVELCPVDGEGHPLPRINWGLIPDADISEDYSWVSLAFDWKITSPLLDAATKYCIVVHGLNVDVDNAVMWACGGDGSGYPGGDQEWSINGGGDWTTDTTRDQLFRCFATPFLDNYSGTVMPFVAHLLDSPLIWAGQSFTAMKSYRLDRIDVWIEKRGFVGTLDVKLFAVDVNGHPTGLILARGYIQDADIGTSGSFVRCDLVDRHDIVVDTKYCSVVHGSGLGGANKIYIASDDYVNDSDYAGGDLEWSTNGGGTWITTDDRDLLFRCYPA